MTDRPTAKLDALAERNHPAGRMSDEHWEALNRATGVVRPRGSNVISLDEFMAQGGPEGG